MRLGPKLIMFGVLIVCCGFFTACGTDQPADDQDGVTFRLTSLTKEPVHLQHGIETYFTLNMIENGGSDAISINDPPEFPLTATLEYQTVDGQKRKVSSAYGYRC